ncbi:MAG: hypothetical protein HYU97_06945 [Deltaproteobacteria bacterium]|nr:hypothetical protein [Deltaproteobacteria bacterium]
MNLKKLIMLGFFALTLVACGGSTSTDNNDNNSNNGGGNPGGNLGDNPNPPMVTPVPTPIPSEGPVEQQGGTVNCTAFIQDTNKCIRAEVCNNGDGPCQLVALNVCARYDATGQCVAQRACFVTGADESGDIIECGEEAVAPVAPPAPPPADGNNGGGARVNSCDHALYAAVHPDICGANSKCANVDYAALNPGICGDDNANFAVKCQGDAFRLRNWQLCKGIPIAAREEAAPAGGNGGGSYQLPNIQLNCRWENSTYTCNDDDNEPVTELCVVGFYRDDHGRQQPRRQQPIELPCRN